MAVMPVMQCVLTITQVLVRMMHQENLMLLARTLHMLSMRQLILP